MECRYAGEERPFFHLVFSTLFLYGEIEKQERKKETENEGKTQGVMTEREQPPAQQGF